MWKRIVSVWLALTLVCSLCVMQSSLQTGAEETAGMTDRWLSLSTNTSGPRYFVDSDGNPVQLFGMARCQYHHAYEDRIFSETGGTDALIKHYTDAGCNFIRLAVSFTEENNTKDLVVECGGYNTEGINRFITQYVDPDVQTIIRSGAYVMIDQHNYIPGDYCDSLDHAMEYAYSHFQPVMIEIAKRYADEPMVGVIELWNEPYAADQQGLMFSNPAWSNAVRDYFIDTVNKVRQYDTRHVLMVSDWNAGWGCATESTWSGSFGQLDPVYRNTCFSIHLAREHVTDSLSWYQSTLQSMSNRNNICLMFGEIETEENLMSVAGMRNLLNFMNDTQQNYHFSGCLWRPHENDCGYYDLWAPFTKEYATVFPAQDDSVVIEAENPFETDDYVRFVRDETLDGDPLTGTGVSVREYTTQDQLYQFGTAGRVYSAGEYRVDLLAKGGSNYSGFGFGYRTVDGAVVQLGEFFHTSYTETVRKTVTFTSDKKIAAFVLYGLGSTMPGAVLDRIVLYGNFRAAASNGSSPVYYRVGTAGGVSAAEKSTPWYVPEMKIDLASTTGSCRSVKNASEEKRVFSYAGDVLAGDGCVSVPVNGGASASVTFRHGWGDPGCAEELSGFTKLLLRVRFDPRDNVSVNGETVTTLDWILSLGGSYNSRSYVLQLGESSVSLASYIAGLRENYSALAAGDWVDLILPFDRAINASVADLHIWFAPDRDWTHTGRISVGALCFLKDGFEKTAAAILPQDSEVPAPQAVLLDGCEGTWNVTYNSNYEKLTNSEIGEFTTGWGTNTTAYMSRVFHKGTDTEGSYAQVSIIKNPLDPELQYNSVYAVPAPGATHISIRIKLPGVATVLNQYAPYSKYSVTGSESYNENEAFGIALTGTDLTNVGVTQKVFYDALRENQTELAKGKWVTLKLKLNKPAGANAAVSSLLFKFSRSAVTNEIPFAIRQIRFLLPGEMFRVGGAGISPNGGCRQRFLLECDPDYVSTLEEGACLVESGLLYTSAPAALLGNGAFTLNGTLHWLGKEYEVCKAASGEELISRITDPLKSGYAVRGYLIYSVGGEIRPAVYTDIFVRTAYETARRCYEGGGQNTATATALENLLSAYGAD